MNMWPWSKKRRLKTMSEQPTEPETTPTTPDEDPDMDTCPWCEEAIPFDDESQLEHMQENHPEMLPKDMTDTTPPIPGPDQRCGVPKCSVDGPHKHANPKN